MVGAAKKVRPPRVAAATVGVARGQEEPGGAAGGGRLGADAALPKVGLPVTDDVEDRPHRRGPDGGQGPRRDGGILRKVNDGDVVRKRAGVVRGIDEVRARDLR